MALLGFLATLCTPSTLKGRQLLIWSTTGVSRRSFLIRHGDGRHEENANLRACRFAEILGSRSPHLSASVAPGRVLSYKSRVPFYRAHVYRVATGHGRDMYLVRDPELQDGRYMVLAEPVSEPRWRDCALPCSLANLADPTPLTTEALPWKLSAIAPVP